MDPLTGFALEGAQALFSGGAQSAQAKAQAQRSDVNAFIARTRALQADAAARINSEDEVGGIRTSLAATGATPSVSTLELLQGARQIRESERQVSVGNERQRAFDFDFEGRNARARARATRLGAAISLGPSLFSLADN